MVYRSDVTPQDEKISRLKSASKALNTTRALADPGFAHAVLENYARTKLLRGRNKFQVSYKLECLEKKMPHFANDFHAVRSLLGLSPSRVLAHAPPPPYTKECTCACTCGAGHTTLDTAHGDVRAAPELISSESETDHSRPRSASQPSPRPYWLAMANRSTSGFTLSLAGSASTVALGSSAGSSGSALSSPGERADPLATIS